MKKPPYLCGLDFGTSNSVICAISTDPHGDPSPVVMSEPTVLFFPWRNTKDTFTYYVGQEAVQKYVEMGMHGRFIQSLKSVLHDPDFDMTMIYGVPFTPIELTELILTNLKQKMEAKLGTTLDTVVMGRPVMFSEDPEEDQTAQRRIHSAARKCGFKYISFQLEPIGAAYSYEARLTKAETVLVVDLGGGTTDYTIMNLDPQKRHALDRTQDILATGGVHIGGDDFDASIMWHALAPYFGYGSQFEDWNRLFDFPIHFFTTLCTWYDIAKLKESPFKEDLHSILRTSTNKPAVRRLKTLIEEDLGFGLFKAIEHTKKAFSELDQTSIHFESPHLSVHEPVSRAAFEGYIAEHVEAIHSALTETLQRAHKKEADIDSILMTGGSSLVSVIQTTMAARFGGNKIIPDSNRFTGVAVGLALGCGYSL